MVEKNIQSMLGKWLRDHIYFFNGTVVMELKLEKGKSMAFDKVSEHQLLSLGKAKTTGLYHKINDAPIFAGMKTRFTNAKPFDCFYLKGVEAYIVIVYYKLRKPKEFLFIDVDRFLSEKCVSERKSLTEKRAIEISTHNIIIKNK